MAESSVPPAVDGDLAAQHAAAGLALDADTAATLWDGARLDA